MILLDHEISVDLFCGGGGASTGVEGATGRHVTVAVNHDAHAIEMHARNHKRTIHLQRDVYDVSPRAVARRRPVGLLWASPDCTHFSRAKGGTPRRREIRDLAWVVVDWARDVRPRIIAMENVPEFTTWGPLTYEGQPDRSRRGEHFDEFIAHLRGHGYRVEWRTLVAADYGAPTTRKRWYLVARYDAPIRWPEPTHGPGRPLPWRTAAECIDWTIPCPSIFERARPLAEATQRRIAEGLRRFVLQSASPYIVRFGHQSSDAGKVRSAGAPLSTITSKAEHVLVAPTLVQTGYGEREGQAPRCLDIEAPLGTVVGGGSKHGLVAAWLAKHYGGVVGHGPDRPLGTVTGTDHHSACAAYLTRFYGTSPDGAPLDAPLGTVTGGGGRGGGHAGLVAAFLVKYYGQGGQWSGLDEPMHTLVSKARMGLVEVLIDGEPYVVTDIGMRMLQPRELARAQGFPDSYVLTGTKSQQVERIGNSVVPQVAAAIIAAQGAPPARMAT